PGTMRAVRGMKNNVPLSGADVKKQATVPRLPLGQQLSASVGNMKPDRCSLGGGTKRIVKKGI
ncbi:MAG: hypothetical protein ACP5QA_14005, partial [Phycisphaerae bacterium]